MCVWAASDNPLTRKHIRALDEGVGGGGGEATPPRHRPKLKALTSRAHSGGDVTAGRTGQWTEPPARCESQWD